MIGHRARNKYMYLFSKAQFSQTLHQACDAATSMAGKEICGLIVDTGCHLSFVSTRNTSLKSGSFELSRSDVRRIVAASKVLGQEIIGTFHSHPIGIAVPGGTDIHNAVDDSLMFIFDCMGKNGQLWKIKSGKARSLPFGFIKSTECEPCDPLKSTALDA